MKKVSIKRIKKTKTKLSAKAKVLAGLGLGTTLAGFGAGGAGAKATNLKPMVRVQEQNKDSKSGKVKKAITDIFGIKEAKAMANPYADPTDISPALAESLAAQGRYNMALYGSGGVYGNFDYSSAQDSYNQTFGIKPAVTTEQTGSGETETEGDALPTDGQTEDLGEGSGEGYFPEVPTAPIPPIIQQGINQMYNTPAPVAVGADSYGNQIYLNNGQYQDYTGNVFTSHIENGQTVFNPVNTTDPLNLGQSGASDQVPVLPVGLQDPNANIILNNSQTNADNFLNQPWQLPADVQTQTEDVTENNDSNVITNLQTNEQFQGEGSGYVVGQDAQGNNIYQDSQGNWLDSSGNILPTGTVNNTTTVTDTVTPIDYSLATYDINSNRTDNQVVAPIPSVVVQNLVQGSSGNVSDYITTLGQQGVMTLLNNDGTYTLLDVSTGQTEQKTLEQMVESSITVGTGMQNTGLQVENISIQDLANINQQISSGLTADLIRNYISQTPEVAPEVMVPVSSEATIATENTSTATPIMTQSELNAELAKYQSGKVELLTVPEIVTSLDFSKRGIDLPGVGQLTTLDGLSYSVTLPDGGKLTTVDGVNYTDGKNNYTYEGGFTVDNKLTGQFYVTPDEKTGWLSKITDTAKNIVSDPLGTVTKKNSKENKSNQSLLVSNIITSEDGSSWTKRVIIDGKIVNVDETGAAWDDNGVEVILSDSQIEQINVATQENAQILNLSDQTSTLDGVRDSTAYKLATKSNIFVAIGDFAWNKLSPTQQKQMDDFFKKTSDGIIEYTYIDEVTGETRVVDITKTQYLAAQQQNDQTWNEIGIVPKGSSGVIGQTTSGAKKAAGFLGLRFLEQPTDEYGNLVDEDGNIITIDESETDSTDRGVGQELNADGTVKDTGLDKSKLIPIPTTSLPLSFIGSSFSNLTDIDSEMAGTIRIDGKLAFVKMTQDGGYLVGVGAEDPNPIIYNAENFYKLVAAQALQTNGNPRSSSWLVDDVFTGEKSSGKVLDWFNMTTDNGKEVVVQPQRDGTFKVGFPGDVGQVKVLTYQDFLDNLPKSYQENRYAFNKSPDVMPINSIQEFISKQGERILVTKTAENTYTAVVNPQTDEQKIVSGMSIAQINNIISLPEGDNSGKKP